MSESTRGKRWSCKQCLRPEGLCYCDSIISKYNDWPVLILQTRQESRHPLNTGRMVALSLSKVTLTACESVAAVDTALAAASEQSAAKPLLLFPSPNAIALDSITTAADRLPGSQPAQDLPTLVFIDASWRKAKRLWHESAALRALQNVYLPTAAGQYFLRSANKHHSQIDGEQAAALSTLETVAQCLGILEQRSDYYQSLSSTLQTALQRQAKYLPEARRNELGLR